MKIFFGLLFVLLSSSHSFGQSGSNSLKLRCAQNQKFSINLEIPLTGPKSLENFAAGIEGNGTYSSISDNGDNFSGILPVKFYFGARRHLYSVLLVNIGQLMPTGGKQIIFIIDNLEISEVVEKIKSKKPGNPLGEKVFFARADNSLLSGLGGVETLPEGSSFTCDVM